MADHVSLGASSLNTITELSEKFYKNRENPTDINELKR